MMKHLTFLAAMLASTGGGYEAVHIPGLPLPPPVGKRGKTGVARCKRAARKRRNQLRAKRCAA